MVDPTRRRAGGVQKVHGRAERPEDATGGTYREILGQPAVRWLTVLTFVGVFVGYGQFEARLPRVMVVMGLVWALS
jgi:hypothetical protein